MRMNTHERDDIRYNAMGGWHVFHDTLSASTLALYLRCFRGRVRLDGIYGLRHTRECFRINEDLIALHGGSNTQMMLNSS